MLSRLSVDLGNLLLSLSEILDIANPYISSHQQKTAYIAIEIAKAADIKNDEFEITLASALLHDIGAISIEEKTLLHENKIVDTELHCVRGEALIDGFSICTHISRIIRYHHTRYIDLEQAIDDRAIFISQIVHLADYIERHIDKSRCILHQNEDIIESVKKLANIQIYEKIIKAFIEIARKEDFWLNLSSKRLYTLLLKQWPSRKTISITEISQFSELFKKIIDFKSPFTATHTSGVEACTEKISSIFGFSENDIQQLKLAGAFHDIGKLTIPESILNKPDELTKNEMALMKSHVYYTYYTLSSITGLQHIAEWAAFHHEKLDGSGYPFHFVSDKLSVGSKIIAVADIFTALKEDRPYRKGMKKEKITDIFLDYRKSKILDPHLIDLLFDNYDDINTYLETEQEKAISIYKNIFNNFKPNKLL